MFDTLYIAQLPELPFEAREVVKEIDDRPHLLVRIEISGGYFPHRAPEPFIRIITGKKVETSWFAEISEDNRSLVGYFPTNLPRQGTVEFGYGDEVMGRLKLNFAAKNIARLDRKRLPKDVVVVSADLLKAKRQAAAGNTGTTR
jgi:hypothetical protein